MTEAKAPELFAEFPRSIVDVIDGRIGLIYNHTRVPYQVELEIVAPLREEVNEVEQLLIPDVTHYDLRQRALLHISIAHI
jgi:hypothetical protein